MKNNTRINEIIERLKDRPELIEKLGELFELEDDVDQCDLVQIELQTLELIKAIGADCFSKTVQAKEPQAFNDGKAKTSGRMHGKKN